MSHKIDRLQLIRERHRKLILEPRQKHQYDVFADWEDDFDLPDEKLILQSYLGNDQDEE